MFKYQLFDSVICLSLSSRRASHFNLIVTFMSCCLISQTYCKWVCLLLLSIAHDYQKNQRDPLIWFFKRHAWGFEVLYRRRLDCQYAPEMAQCSKMT